jgi:hypothetical protein
MSDLPSFVRRAWCRAQGLHGAGAESVAALIAQTGWVRTLGGADGYLSLAARQPGLAVAQVHAELASGDIAVVPAVRGCVYLVPREHVPVALAIADALSARRRARELEKVDVEAAELEQVCTAVEQALEAGPVSVHELKKRLPEGLVRHLGPAGKKIGLTTSLTPALRQMEVTGRLQRRLLDDRMDHERYSYGLPEAELSPLPTAAATVEMVRLALRWFAPTTAAGLAAFTGLTKTACKRALSEIGAPQFDLELDGQPTFASPDSSPDTAPLGISLLPGLDNLLAWQGPASFVPPEELDREVVRWGMQKGSTWATVKHVLSRTILVDGLVVGEWEWDAAAQELVLGSYGAPLPEGVQAQAADRARVIQELGHAHAFSIEKPERLAKRAARVRALGRG